jgi:HlyD family secretion protein
MTVRRFPLSVRLIGLGLLQGCGPGTPDNVVVGTLEWNRIELIAEVSEPILAWRVREGEWVEPGRELLQLDPARRLAQMDQARAAGAQAAARLQELERGPRTETIAEAKARLKGASQVYEARARQFQRQRSLSRKSAGSLEAADAAESLHDAALAERDAARARVNELEAGTRHEQIAQARWALAEADAAIKRLQLDLDRLTVRAPVPGRVDSLPLHPGSQPQAGRVVAVLLAGKPYARVYIPELLRAKVAPGDPARIQVDGIPSPFEGRVRSVEAEPLFTPFYALTERDRKRLSFLAKIDFVNDVRELPSGLALQAELPKAAAPPNR